MMVLPGVSLAQVTEVYGLVRDQLTGEVVEFQNEELERLKVRIARELGYDLVDHRLELYGKKVKGKSKK